jgi:hypothetical protein
MYGQQQQFNPNDFESLDEDGENYQYNNQQQQMGYNQNYNGQG